MTVPKTSNRDRNELVDSEDEVADRSETENRQDQSKAAQDDARSLDKEQRQLVHQANTAPKGILRPPSINFLEHPVVEMQGVAKTGEASFCNNPRKLLYDLAIGINAEARSQQQKEAAPHFQSRTSRERIARSIFDTILPPSVNSEELHDSGETIDNTELLESWLVGLAGQIWEDESKGVDEKRGLHLDLDEGWDSETSLRDDDQWMPKELTKIPNIAEMGAFTYKSVAFQKLFTDLAAFGLQRSASLVHTLLSIHSKNIRFTERERTGLPSTIKGFFEYNSGVKCCWWPLAPPRRQLNEGEVRIDRIYHCGTHQWQELEKPQADDVKRFIKTRGRAPRHDDHLRCNFRKEQPESSFLPFQVREAANPPGLIPIACEARDHCLQLFISFTLKHLDRFLLLLFPPATSILITSAPAFPVGTAEARNQNFSRPHLSGSPSGNRTGSEETKATSVDCNRANYTSSNTIKRIPKEKHRWDKGQVFHGHDRAWGIEPEYCISAFAVTIYTLLILLWPRAFLAYWLEIFNPWDLQDAVVLLMISQGFLSIFWVEAGFFRSEA